jgi:uncharacterized protein
MRAYRIAFAAALSIALLLGAAARAEMNLMGPNSDIVAAALTNDVDRVRKMLAGGVSPNWQDRAGRTALTHAASAGNVEMMQVLLQAGARPDLADAVGNAALHWAIERNQPEAARVLIEVKAPIDQENRRGVTPLMLAASHGNRTLVKMLLDAGADPRRTDYTGRDAATIADESRQPAIAQLLRTGKR